LKPLNQNFGNTPNNNNAHGRAPFTAGYAGAVTFGEAESDIAPLNKGVQAHHYK
jgi:hypothetical protein